MRFASVELRTVPTWLRHYPVLSDGEVPVRPRAADMRTPIVVVDEFTSVVDRQITRIRARFPGVATDQKRCVLLSPYYDIIGWLQPDWVYDTATSQWTGGVFRAPKTGTRYLADGLALLALV